MFEKLKAHHVQVTTSSALDIIFRAKDTKSEAITQQVVYETGTDRCG